MEDHSIREVTNFSMVPNKYFTFSYIHNQREHSCLIFHKYRRSLGSSLQKPWPCPVSTPNDRRYPDWRRKLTNLPISTSVTMLAAESSWFCRSSMVNYNGNELLTGNFTHTQNWKWMCETEANFKARRPLWIEKITHKKGPSSVFGFSSTFHFLNKCEVASCHKIKINKRVDTSFGGFLADPADKFY